MAWLVTAAAGALAAAGIGLRHWRHRRQWQQHLLRLATDIIETADSIQLDVAGLPRSGAVVDLAGRAARCRARAEHACRFPRPPGEALAQAIGELHEQHRRIVDLRSELDRLMAARERGETSGPAPRFATSSKAALSRWPSTSSPASSSPMA